MHFGDNLPDLLLLLGLWTYHELKHVPYQISRHEQLYRRRFVWQSLSVLSVMKCNWISDWVTLSHVSYVNVSVIDAGIFVARISRKRSEQHCQARAPETWKASGSSHSKFSVRGQRDATPSCYSRYEIRGLSTSWTGNSIIYCRLMRFV
jgi:hypothetical protein